MPDDPKPTGQGTPTPAAATPPAGTPPAGTPPAGTPPAGTPPAGTPPAGTPPAGTPATPPTVAQLQDAAFAAVEAANADPSKPELKEAAKKAVDAAKAAATEASKPPVEHDYKGLKLPENSVLDTAHVEKVAAFAKERGLSPKVAQEILERDNAAVVEFQQAQTKALDTEVAAWVETAKADPEFGGVKLPENIAVAKRFLDKYGSEDLKKQLRATGLGDHPELIRLCYRAGLAMQDDKIIPGNTPAGAQKSVADKFYPTQEKKE